MARGTRKAAPQSISRDERLQAAERRCADYRRAFQMLLDEPFDDLDKTIDRMLRILAATLDVDARVRERLRFLLWMRRVQTEGPRHDPASTPASPAPTA